MKKLTLLIFFILLMTPILIGQFRCDSFTKASDTPPGCTICNFSYSGNTKGFTIDTGIDFPCGTINNNQWLTLHANEAGLFHSRFFLQIAKCL